MAYATVVITNEHIEALIEVAQELQHGRITAEGTTMLHVFGAACFQELLERRRVQAEIEALSRRVDNVFTLVLPNFEEQGTDAGAGGAA
ncbi:hypothetical protein [Roseicyclus amphidinii]|uniref:hypothetical protein n=1 Tax=Roseicyclus amphidinii TaxID=3034232 RepID=UPI0024E17D03|nr:hypothetical protein [Roseicyclus sp. Amp-Y-6]